MRVPPEDWGSGPYRRASARVIEPKFGSRKRIRIAAFFDEKRRGNQLLYGLWLGQLLILLAVCLGLAACDQAFRFQVDAASDGRVMDVRISSERAGAQKLPLSTVTQGDLANVRN